MDDLSAVMGEPLNSVGSQRDAERVELQASLLNFFLAHEHDMAETFGLLAVRVNNWMRAQGFWESRNIGEKLMLITTEVAEACEAHRKGRITYDTSNPLRIDTLEEELADVVVRVLDLAGELELDLGRAIARKMRANLLRPRKHGKAY